MVIRFIAKFFLIMLLLISNITSVLAATNVTTSKLDFGSIRVGQPTQSATIGVTTAGSYEVNSTNITSRTSPTAGEITTTYTASGIGEWFWGTTKTYTATATPGTLSCSSGHCQTSGAACTIQVTPILEQTNFQIRVQAWSGSGSGTNETKLGGRLSISAGCSGGTYTGPIAVEVRNTTDNETDSVNLNVQVVLEPQPITISNVQDMDFGTLLSHQTHTVTISPASNCTMQNPSMKADTVCQAGQFEIENNEPGSRSVTITFPTSINLTNTSSNDTMTVSSFTGKIGSTDIIPSGNTITTGNQYIYVGATLTVPQGASSGDYQGNYTVTIGY